MEEKSDNIKPEDLIAKILSKQASEEEVTHFNSLIKDPDFRQSFEAYESVWQKTSVARKPLDVESALNKVNDRITGDSPTNSKSNNWFLKIAAILVISLGIFSVLFKSDLLDSETKILANLEDVHHSLPDGSIIDLQQGSTISYESDFDGPVRKVNLIGKAFFNVTKNPDRPFIIHTSKGAEVKVVGTSFLIDESANEVSVVVESGKVILSDNVENDENQAILVAGDRGQLNLSSNEVNKTLNNDPQFLFWLNKTLIFRKTEMSLVIETLNELFQTNIVLKNEKVGNCKLSASFKNEDIDTILGIISQTLGLTVNKGDSSIEIDGAPC